MYGHVQFVIEACESLLVGDRIRPDGMIARFRRAVAYPFKVIAFGMKRGIQDLERWTIASVALMVILGYVTPHALPPDLPEGSRIFVAVFFNLVLVLVPLVIALFPTPSQYASRAVSVEILPQAAAMIRELKLDVRQRDCFRTEVEELSGVAEQRASALRWMGGILWAGWVYLASKAMEGWIEQVHAGRSAGISPNVVAIYLALLCLGTFYFTVDSYSRAIRVLMTTVRFAVDECEFPQSQAGI